MSPADTAAASVLVVGEALVDLTRGAGRDEIARPGGSPLNVAVGMSRLGVPVTLATQLGDDDYGELMRDHLDDSDVDVRSLPPHHSDTSTAVADIARGGGATYSFDLTWDPSELPVPTDFTLVHVGSIGTTLAPGADAVASLAANAARGGIAFSLDPNVRLDITPDVSSVIARFDALVGCAAVCKLSDEDAAVLRPGVEPDAVLARICELGAALAVMTFGADGALLVSGDALVEVPARPVAVVDTIGAGDSFMAALLAGLVLDGSLGSGPLPVDELSRLGELASAAAAITCSRPGADPPWMSELPLLRG